MEVASGVGAGRPRTGGDAGGPDADRESAYRSGPEPSRGGARTARSVRPMATQIVSRRGYGWRSAIGVLCILAGFGEANRVGAGTWASHGPEGGRIAALAIDSASPNTV